MTSLVFYEKPGCVSNARQRALLAALGLGLAPGEDLQASSRPDGPACPLPVPAARGPA